MPELRALSANQFILESPALESFLYDREVVGVPLLDAARAATCDWLAALYEREFLEPACGQCAGLTILTGALYYGLQSAWQTTFRTLLPENFVGVRRRLEGDRWVADHPYTSFEAPAQTMLLCDTVASGVSVCEAIRTFVECGTQHGLESVHVFSACGSGIGAQRILETCGNLGLRATFTHGLAAFGLARLGWHLPDTDLPWLHEDTITQERHRQRAEQMFCGKPVCAIGDWGLRCKNPDAYLKEWEEEKKFWGL